MCKYSVYLMLMTCILLHVTNCKIEHEITGRNKVIFGAFSHTTASVLTAWWATSTTIAFMMTEVTFQKFVNISITQTCQLIISLY